MLQKFYLVGYFAFLALIMIMIISYSLFTETDDLSSNTSVQPYFSSSASFNFFSYFSSSYSSVSSLSLRSSSLLLSNPSYHFPNKTQYLQINSFSDDLCTELTSMNYYLINNCLPSGNKTRGQSLKITLMNDHAPSNYYSQHFQYYSDLECQNPSTITNPDDERHIILDTCYKKRILILTDQLPVSQPLCMRGLVLESFLEKDTCPGISSSSSSSSSSPPVGYSSKGVLELSFFFFGHCIQHYRPSTGVVDFKINSCPTNHSITGFYFPNSKDGKCKGKSIPFTWEWSMPTTTATTTSGSEGSMMNPFDQSITLCEKNDNQTTSLIDMLYFGYPFAFCPLVAHPAPPLPPVHVAPLHRLVPLASSSALRHHRSPSPSLPVTHFPPC
jgi:hypothetical protein